MATRPLRDGARFAILDSQLTASDQETNALAKINIDPSRRAEIGRERRSRTRARIIAAAFELFGEEKGLYSRIEDVADKAGVTRPTFYRHFSGMEDLREALTHEVTHDLLQGISSMHAAFPDPRMRTASAARIILRHAQRDRRWAWSMVNMSANGIIFGRESQREAQLTIEQGIAASAFSIPSSTLGRDVVLGITLAGIATILRQPVPDDYPESLTCSILLGLGVPHREAVELSQCAIPELPVT